MAKYNAASTSALITDGQLQSYPSSADYQITYPTGPANAQFTVTATGTGATDC